MVAIWMGIVGALKHIFLKVMSQKFFEWLFFWSATMLVESTKTTKDDEFLKEVRRIYDEG